MVATNAALASGGITHCCLRCGLGMFFLSSPPSCCRWRARQCAVRRPPPRADAGSIWQSLPGPAIGDHSTPPLAPGSMRAPSLVGSTHMFSCGTIPRPIRLAWSALVFPSLVLNYAGQAAIVLEGAPTTDNVFYRLCPSALLIPSVPLAPLATITASQSSLPARSP